MSRAMVTVPLDIPDVRIVRTEMNTNNELLITIESTKQGVACRVCGPWIEKFHGQDAWVTVRHLPVFGRPTCAIGPNATNARPVLSGRRQPNG